MNLKGKEFQFCMSKYLQDVRVIVDVKNRFILQHKSYLKTKSVSLTICTKGLPNEKPTGSTIDL